MSSASDPPSHPSTSSSSAFEAEAEARRLERERKGKEKKLRKQIERGKLSEAAAARLLAAASTTSSSSASSSSAAATALASARMELKLDARKALLHPEDVQRLVLWLAGGQMGKPTWVQAVNRGLINAVVLLLVRGAVAEDFGDIAKRKSRGPGAGTGAEETPAASASSAASPLTPTPTPLPFLTAHAWRRIKHPRAVWNLWQRIVKPVDSKVLLLPRNAVLVDDVAGGKRKRGGGSGGGSDEENGGGGEEDDEDDGDGEEEEVEDAELDGVTVARRLFPHCVRLAELRALGFPLHLSVPPPSSTSDAAAVAAAVVGAAAESTGSAAPADATAAPSSSSSGADLPMHRPGRVAGASNSLRHRCSLPLPRGYLLTRTAHRDLHAAFPHTAAACPILAALGGSVAVEELGNGNDEGSRDLPLGLLPGPRLLGLDCEMCSVGDKEDRQLARATIVDGRLVEQFAADTDGEDDEEEEDRGPLVTGAPLLDAYVKPERPVVDHLTRFSGVTAKLLAAAELDIEQAQERVADILDGVGLLAPAASAAAASAAASGVPSKRARLEVGLGGSASSSAPGPEPLRPAILVGHSLDSDLRALRVIHTRVADTSLSFPHPSGLPYRLSLRALAKTQLGLTIQAGHGKGGHDSAEDANAALDLIRMLVEGEAEEAEEEDGEGPGAGRAADGVVVPPSFLTHFLGPARETFSIPAAEGSGSSVAAAASVASRGVAGALAMLTSGAGATTTAAASAASATAAPTTTDATMDSTTTPAVASSSSRGPRASRSILALPDMANTARVAGVAVVGSPPFVASTVAGTASALPVPSSSASALPSAASARRITDKIVAEMARVAAARRDGRAGPASSAVVVAELPAPASAAAAEGDGEGDGDGDVGAAPRPDLPVLDRILSGLCASLPPGTAVVAVTQAARLRFGSTRGRGGGGASSSAPAASGWRDGGSGTMDEETAATATRAQYGMVFVHVASQAAAAAGK
jgi:DNA polymerase III epsilon subunit-like protein